MPEREHVDFVFGDRSESFELAFDEQSLARFVGLAAQALAEVEALRDNENETAISVGVGLVRR
ncbi:hypothetical protein [Actinokineospora sp.]|uniref:hypothetical protein n=1 Tax=Actinokineospora sp. TaxID=1872133 RepID=UPI004037FB90